MENTKISAIALTVALCGVASVMLLRPSLLSGSIGTNLNEEAMFKPDDTKRTLGIDVSHYQGDVNWQKVVNSNVKFAYSKATQGAQYVDKKFSVNQLNATAAGIPFGAYHFFSPDKDVVKQIAHFVKHANVQLGSLPPVLDIETMSKKSSDNLLVEDILQWINGVKQATNCQPILYAGLAFYNRHLTTLPTDIPFWLAEYSNEVTMPKGIDAWSFWQQSQSASIPGIKGNVDLDWFAGAEEDLQAITCK